MDYLSIQELELNDFRCFSRAEIDFHPRMTVLIAPNGAGKTSILDAVAVALGPFVGAIYTGIGRHFQGRDIRLWKTGSNAMEAVPRGVHLCAKGRIADVPSTWRRSLASPKKAKTTIRDAKNLIDYGKDLQWAVKTGEAVTLPLLAYYGTGRLWQKKKMMDKRAAISLSRLAGYADCLDPASTYKAMVENLAHWSENALTEKLAAWERGIDYQPGEFDSYLASVDRAINACLASVGWRNVRYSVKTRELVAEHSQFGLLPVDLLSDGVRNMIAMIGDMAFRATRLNSHLGADASRETPGIVLIDEVDMHLHPQWQQQIIGALEQAFPKVQFIVTTHSPQVLSTVSADKIRILNSDDQNMDEERMMRAKRPLGQTRGEASNMILHGVMGVDPVPPMPESEMLDRLQSLLAQGEYAGPQVEALLQELADSLGQGHSQILALRREIRRLHHLASLDS